MSDELFIPRNPKTVPIRPLNKGVVRDISSQMLPPGAFWDVINYIPDVDGVRRRPAVSQVVAGSGTVLEADIPLVDVAPFWSSGGLRKNLLIGQRGVYTWQTQGGTISRLDWDYPDPAGSGTLAQVSGSTWTLTDGTETFVTGGVVIGDILVVSGQYARITAVAETELTLNVKSAFSSAFTPPEVVTYQVLKGFDPVAGWAPDWAAVDGKTILSGNARRGLLYYDGSGIGELNAAQSPELQAIRTVAFMDDRVWIGGMSEDGLREPQRIRWTSKTDFTSFPAANFVDLPYTDSEIVRVVPLGSLMVVYMETAIFIGRPANFTDVPLYFEHFETGGTGLVSPKAVAQYLDGQFYVSQNDIYFISASAAPEAIGNRQIREDLRNCSDLGAVYASQDPANNRVLFVIPGVGGDRIWSFNYRSKAWSYDEYSADFIACLATGESLTYSDLSVYGSYTDWAADYPTIGSMQGKVAQRELFIGEAENLNYLLRTGTEDTNGVITAVLETGDMDLDAPDQIKTLKRVTLKVRRSGDSGVLLSGEELEFTVEVSVDGGYTWKQTPKTLVISEGENEGKVTMRVTGSTHRIRFTSASSIEPYTVTEMVLLVVGRGRENRF
jgi:hypothetical protein